MASSATGGASTTWQDEIRSLEEEARVAFLKVDLPTLEGLWADGFSVNSPLQRVVDREQLLDLLRTGRVRHLAHECEIELMSRYGDVAVVMGRDRVVDPPDGAVSHRRFTNVWQRDNGAWRLIARHAHVITRETGEAGWRL